ncbi:hypothetical protein GcM1_250004 [Golovinomyces cichoracearum]|uniref:Uncharacterized protein n=1 Tax=Golovinomyces cichoracearum TaxID=62708 RepID=A0A420IAM3_9PEZI|nr:hypothetical protein GcM1_250004 [Golovinomyces cichoracearum]
MLPKLIFLFTEYDWCQELNLTKLEPGSNGLSINKGLKCGLFERTIEANGKFSDWNANPRPAEKSGTSGPNPELRFAYFANLISSTPTGPSLYILMTDMFLRFYPKYKPTSALSHASKKPKCLFFDERGNTQAMGSKSTLAEREAIWRL